MQAQTTTKCLIPECPHPVKPYRGRGRHPVYCADHEWGHLTWHERKQHRIGLMRERERRAAAERRGNAALVADLRAEIRELRGRLAAIRAFLEGRDEVGELRKGRAA